MKKFLLIFFIAFVSLMTYAQVDTLKLILERKLCMNCKLIL